MSNSGPIVIGLETAADPRLLALAQQKARSEGRSLEIDASAETLVWLTPAQASNAEAYTEALKSVDGDWSRIRIKPS
jgi:hypothetical protein